MSKVYSVREVAELLEVSRYRVRKLINDGSIKVERGPRNMFLIDEFELYRLGIIDRTYRSVLIRKIRGFRVTLAYILMPLAIEQARKEGKLRLLFREEVIEE